ncbi:MAG: phosphate/phosphite/phosphonate ABC transporter substrate-binding protein, partial [Bradymonadaceae bacterium]
LQNAFERSLTSTERRRLLHMTGTSSRSDITREEDSIGTVVERPGSDGPNEPTMQYKDGPRSMEGSASKSGASHRDSIDFGHLRDPDSPTATADVERSGGSSVTASQALATISGPAQSASFTTDSAGIGLRHFAILGILIVFLLAGIVVLWPGRDSPTSQAARAPILIGEPLPLGWAPTVDPDVLVNEVRPLHEYLERTTGRPMPLILAADYGELSEMLREGKIAFAVLPPLLYVRTKVAEPGVELLALKEFDGGTSSDAILLVHMQSNIRSLEDLEGKTFCFVDPNSTTGYFLPREYIRSQGYDPEEFVGKVHWSGDHLQALRDLSAKTCDAAATYSGAFLSGDEFGIPIGRLRQLAIIGHVPQDIVTAGPGVDPLDRQKISDALIAFDPMTHMGIKRLGDNQRITGFQKALESDFDLLRSAVEAAPTPTP